MEEGIKSSEKKLTLKQEVFCRLYASDREFFGNGVQAYLEAYDIDKSKKSWYQVSRNEAHKLLSKTEIADRIKEILDMHLNDQIVDKELSFLILQHADLSVKVRAICEYNRMKGRYSLPKAEQDNGWGMTDEQAMRLLNLVEAKKRGPHK